MSLILTGENSKLLMVPRLLQIRSHAQKYFLKVQKNGHVPPSRPKKKAAHPYPLKTTKLDGVISSSIDVQGYGPTGETYDQNEVKHRMFGRVMPDFPKVYRFIGGIFDPNESNHILYNWEHIWLMDF